MPTDPMETEDGATFQLAIETKQIILDPTHPEKFTVIGSNIGSKYEGELVDFLRENRDIFAWSPKDMPGVPTDFAEHKLHVRSDAKPVRQPLRRLSEEKICRRRDSPTSSSRLHYGSFLPGVAGKSGPSAKEEQAMANVY